MTRTARWIVAALGVLVIMLATLWLLARAWLPSDEQLAAQIGARFESSVGIGLTVGAAHWSLRPVPVIVVENIATAQSPPVTVRRIALRPRLDALLRRELAFDRLEVEGAVLPYASVRAIGDRLPEGDPMARAMGTGWRLADVPLAQLRLREVVWRDRRDIALAYDAEAAFDAPGWRPRTAEVRRAGVSPPARLRLEREAGQASRWRTLIDVGGGSWNGSTTLEETPADGPLRLVAQLEARNVDVEALAAAFGRRSPVAGKLAGQTEVRAEAAKATGLLRALRTHTTFSVRPATLTRLDLVKAVSTAGISRGGQTRLDELSGTLDTQSTDDGVLMRYTLLRARSGLLTASGSARLLNRKLDGEAAVDLVDGVLGVPLKIGGTVDEPELSLTGGALTGAAIGSAVLPGVGTALGARLGQRVEEMFGGGKGRGATSPKKPGSQ